MNALAWRSMVDATRSGIAMNRFLVLLQSITAATLRVVRMLPVVHPNRLPVAPFYGVSRMPEVRWPKRIPVSRTARRRSH